MLELTEARQSFELGAAGAAGAVAAARLLGAGDPRARSRRPAERAFLLAHDSDPFNKWEAGRAYALALARPASRPTRRRRSTPSTSAALAAVADDPALDPAFKALALGLPSEDEVIAARRRRRAACPTRWRSSAPGGRSRRRSPGRSATGSSALRRQRRARPVQPGRRRPPGAGRCAPGRSRLADRARPGGAAARAQFAAAGNMTERMARAGLLVAHGQAEAALGDVPRRLAPRPAGRSTSGSRCRRRRPRPSARVATVEALTRHPDFDWKNPNRFRSLVGSFAGGNPAGFHAADGSGYRSWSTGWSGSIRSTRRPPRGSTATLGTWRMFDAGRAGADAGRARAARGAARASRATPARSSAVCCATGTG